MSIACKATMLPLKQVSLILADLIYLILLRNTKHVVCIGYRIVCNVKLVKTHILELGQCSGCLDRRP